ncbi:hypothetical protein HDU93_001613 [Gonapodya sp. JEL0774]|nr:hypothetical protein HDU93_001613 [Gonapodya sp. JEL0774]
MAQTGASGKRKQKRRAPGTGLNASALNGRDSLPVTLMSPDANLLLVVGHSADAHVVRIMDSRTGSLVCAYSPGLGVKPVVFPGKETLSKSQEDHTRWRTFERAAWAAVPGQHVAVGAGQDVTQATPSKKSRKRTRSSSPIPSRSNTYAPPSSIVLLVPTSSPSLGSAPVLVFSPAENRIISSLPADPAPLDRPGPTPDVADVCSAWQPGADVTASTTTSHFAYVLDTLGRVVEWDLTNPLVPRRTGRVCSSTVKTASRVAVGTYITSGSSSSRRSSDDDDVDDEEDEEMEVDANETPVTVLAVAGSAIEVWQLGSPSKLLKQLPGHPSPITSLAFHPDSRSGLLVSCAEEDSATAATVWHLVKGGVGALPTTAAPTSVRLHHPSGTALLHLASGGISIHRPFPSSAQNATDKRGAPMKPIRVPPDATLDETVIAATFAPAPPANDSTSSSSSMDILAAVGYPATVFHRVSARAESGAWVGTLTLPAVSHGVSEVSTLGMAPTHKYSESSATVAVGGAGAVSGSYKDRVSAKGRKDDGNEERTLAERVKALALATGGVGTSSAGTFRNGSGSGSATPLIAGSLLGPLQQALRTSDTALLDSILVTRDVRSVRATVAKMTATEISKLVDAISERVAKGGRWDGYVGWIEEAVGSSVGAPSAPSPAALSRLHALLDHRVSTYHRMLRLRGRLDAMVNRVNGRGTIAANRTADGNTKSVTESDLEVAAVVYREEDDVGEEESSEGEGSEENSEEDPASDQDRTDNEEDDIEEDEDDDDEQDGDFELDDTAADEDEE